jgi:ubiquinone/menaquinone biosynthesis C-methylase UbiE
MNEEYLADHEYPGFFEKLGGVRRQIAKRLPLKPRMCLLDLATGYGYFALEIAHYKSDVRIVAIDVSASDVDRTRGNVLERGLSDRVKTALMDAARMGFRNRVFDLVVNFLGLEDIHMTRKRAGVAKTFMEVSRVLKPEGEFWFVAMPPEEMESKAQRLETQVFFYTCGATWLSAQAYEKMLSDSGFLLVGKEPYYTRRKLTPPQAREYIQFACQSVSEIYGVTTLPFEEVWKKFGRDIEKEGLGYYSKVVLFRTRNTSQGI